MADWSHRRLHFVGIGGAGMSGLALVAATLGASVTGSDRAESAYTARLREHGIEPAIGHLAANVPDGAQVVVSSAIPPDNPERAPGRELHRADLLAEVAALKRCIAITGTHGKTTTTAMTVHALQGAGLDPAYVVGAELGTTGLGAAWGSGEWIVVEADESDRSLLKLRPQVALLTNAELDHHATYVSRLDLEATFARFLASASEAAVIWDRPELLTLAPPGIETHAYDAPEPVLSDGGSSFVWRGSTVALGVPGAHNAVNAAGALTAAALAGADAERAVAALATFRGARRRFEPLGATAAGVPVYDDYAHHPTEVAAAIAAARTIGARRLVAVFQPHLYSRTQALGTEFGRALAGADLAGVLGIYPARERAEDFPGVDGRVIAAAAADAGGGREVAWLPDFDAARAWLLAVLRPGDVLLVMGAGNVDALGRAVVAG